MAKQVAAIDAGLVRELAEEALEYGCDPEVVYELARCARTGRTEDLVSAIVREVRVLKSERKV